MECKHILTCEDYDKLSAGCHCNACFDRQFQNTADDGGWISIDDRLPEENDLVLACYKPKPLYYFIASLTPTAQWIDRQGYFREARYWMPLPTPPKED